MVQAAHAAAGISIPRVSWDQGAAGVEVSGFGGASGEILYIMDGMWESILEMVR